MTSANTGYVSASSLSGVPLGLVAYQDNQFLLTLFKKVYPLLKSNFQFRKCVLLQAVLLWAVGTVILRITEDSKRQQKFSSTFL